MAPVFLAVGTFQEGLSSVQTVSMPALKREACSTSWSCMNEGTKAGILLTVFFVVVVLFLVGKKYGEDTGLEGWRSRWAIRAQQDEELGLGDIELQPIAIPERTYRRVELRPEYDRVTGRRVLRTRSVRHQPEAPAEGSKGEVTQEEQEGAGARAGHSSKQQEQATILSPDRTIRQVTSQPREPASPASPASPALPGSNPFNNEQPPQSPPPSSSPPTSTSAPRSSMESIPPPPPPPPVVIVVPFPGAPPPPPQAPARAVTYVAYPPPARPFFPRRVDSLPRPAQQQRHQQAPPPPPPPSGPPRLLRQVLRMPSPGRAATMSSSASTSRWETPPISPTDPIPAPAAATPSVPRGLLPGSSDADSSTGSAELAAQRALREDRADREEEERISALRDEPARRSHRRRRPARSTSRPPSPEASASPASRSEMSWSAAGTVGSGTRVESSVASSAVEELRRRLRALIGRREEEEESR